MQFYRKRQELYEYRGHRIRRDLDRPQWAVFSRDTSLEPPWAFVGRFHTLSEAAKCIDRMNEKVLV